MERINLILFPRYSAEKLWGEMKTLDLIQDAPRIDVPVYFLLGRHDVIVSSALAEEYFLELEAPRGKTLHWFEESAHRPQREEREKFLEIMDNIRDRHARRRETTMRTRVVPLDITGAPHDDAHFP
jgi:pimeloyl-ACP methyl ester carboxylesterase